MTWLYDTKTQRKSKIVLHGYRHINYIKTKDIYVDIGRDAEMRFDTSNYESERPLPKGKNKLSLSDWDEKYVVI